MASHVGDRCAFVPCVPSGPFHPLEPACLTQHACVSEVGGGQASESGAQLDMRFLSHMNPRRRADPRFPTRRGRPLPRGRPRRPRRIAPGNRFRRFAEDPSGACSLRLRRHTLAHPARPPRKVDRPRCAPLATAEPGSPCTMPARRLMQRSVGSAAGSTLLLFLLAAPAFAFLAAVVGLHLPRGRLLGANSRSPAGHASPNTVCPLMSHPSARLPAGPARSPGRRPPAPSLPCFARPRPPLRPPLSQRDRPCEWRKLPAGRAAEGDLRRVICGGQTG